MGIGGIEKCLVNLLNLLPEEKYDIDVLLMNPEYDLKQDVVRRVNWLDSFSYVMNTTDTMSEINARGGVIANLSTFVRYCAFRLVFKLRFDAWKLFLPLKTKYDIAIAYSQNDFSPYYIIDRVTADKKLFWYHNGAYEGDKRKYNIDIKYYRKFDHIIAVSTDCAKMLQEKFQFKGEQLQVLRNVYNVNDVRSKAELYVPKSYNSNAFHLLNLSNFSD